MIGVKLEKVILRYPRPFFLTKKRLGDGQLLDAKAGVVFQSSHETDKRFSYLPSSIVSKWRGRLGYQSFSRDDYYECMIFVYSDGQMISLKELPASPPIYLNAHPDGLRWPDLVLALRSQPESEKPLTVWMANHFQYIKPENPKGLKALLWQDAGHASFDALMTSVIHHFSVKPISKNIELGLTFSSSDQIDYYPIKKIETDFVPFFDLEIRQSKEKELVKIVKPKSDRPSDWKDLVADNFSKSIPNQRNEFITQNLYPIDMHFKLLSSEDEIQTPYFSYNESSQVLKVHMNARARWHQIMNLFGEVLAEGSDDQEQDQLQDFLLKNYSLYAVANALSLSPDLVKTHSQSAGEATDLKAFPVVNLASDLSSLDSWIELPEKNGRLINWGKLTYETFQKCSLGLKGFLPDEGKSFVTSRKGLRRNDELKVIRHQGCAFLLAFEMCLFILGRPQTTGESLDNDEAFITYIFHRWSLLVVNQKERLGSEEMILGRGLTDALRKIVFDLLMLYRRKVPYFSSQINQEILQNNSENKEEKTRENNSDHSDKNNSLNTGEQKVSVIFYSTPEAALTAALIQSALKVFGPSIFSKINMQIMGQLFQIENEKLPSWYNDTHDTDSALEITNSSQRLALSAQMRSWHFIPILREFGFKVEINRVPLNELSEDDFKGVISVRSSFEGKQSFFSLNPGVFFRGRKLDPKDLTFEGNGEFIRYKDEVYFVSNKNLPGLKSLMAFWQRLAQEKGAEKLFQEGEQVFVSRHRMLDVLAMTAQGVTLDLDEESERVLEYFKKLGQHSAVVSEIQSQIELKPYQLLGTQWIFDLYELGLGGILSDEMGLGKTAQVLGFFSLLHRKGMVRQGPSLIVLPTSLLHNWTMEATRFFPALKLKILNSGVQIRTHLVEQLDIDTIYVVTYGLMYTHSEILLATSWDTVVFDEAHQLKNLSAQRTGVARQLKSRFKLAVTGTPLENNLIEFYSLFDLVLPGALGALSQFRKQYIEDFSLFKAANIQHLRLRSKPVLLRRTKKSVQLELPDKIETLVQLTMEKKQKDLYRKVAMQFNDEVLSVVDKKGESSAQLHMLAGLTRLRQICSHPGVLESAEYNHIPPKLEYLLTMLPDIIESNESVLIFTQFKKTMDLTVPHLKKLAPVFCLHGGVHTDERQKLLNDFSNSEGPAILFMTLKTGGVGLNLTKASYVFHLDPWWNPAAEDQATDRAHRMGQTKTVNVYRLIMQDTLEERIQEMKGRKRGLYAALFGENQEAAGDPIELKTSQGLSKDDFNYLIGGMRENSAEVEG